MSPTTGTPMDRLRVRFWSLTLTRLAGGAWRLAMGLCPLCGRGPDAPMACPCCEDGRATTRQRCVNYLYLVRLMSRSA